ncbi:hypothetical protein B296_00037153 [Ensete ventricosum]|uniref:OTU domain-containing protein n=1 Tax=Ensete ventricosum TaxID=4639 RepID=A0A426XEZ3_ENSVE|nr:hypothetical protein B296_00037153 [Ensete ventricosum]
MLTYVGIKGGQEDMDDNKPSSSCSSPARNSYEEGYSLDVTDEFSAVDGEVGRRLNQMVPVPIIVAWFWQHVPKINGEIPSVDEATSDHQRLLERYGLLQLYDLVERKVQGDGNCQYGVKIFVITSFKDTCYIEILPSVQKSNRVIFLSFWAEVHYNSIYPEGGECIILCLNDSPIICISYESKYEEERKHKENTL